MNLGEGRKEKYGDKRDNRIVKPKDNEVSFGKMRIHIILHTYLAVDISKRNFISPRNLLQSHISKYLRFSPRGMSGSVREIGDRTFLLAVIVGTNNLGRGEIIKQSSVIQHLLLSHHLRLNTSQTPLLPTLPLLSSTKNALFAPTFIHLPLRNLPTPLTNPISTFPTITLPQRIPQ